MLQHTFSPKFLMDDPETLHGWVKRISIFRTVFLQGQFKHNSQSFSARKVTKEIVTHKLNAFLDYPYLLYTKVCFNLKIECKKDKKDNRSKRWVIIVGMDGGVFQDWLWSWALKTPSVMKTQLRSQNLSYCCLCFFLELTVSLWSMNMKSCLRWRLNWIPYLTWYCTKKSENLHWSVEGFMY